MKPTGTLIYQVIKDGTNHFHAVGTKECGRLNYGTYMTLEDAIQRLKEVKKEHEEQIKRNTCEVVYTLD